MTDAAATTRRFKVHARHIGSHHAWIVQATSSEAAAVACLEVFDLSDAATGGHGVSIIVHDLGAGDEHCFRLDVDSGEISASGQAQGI